jgi:hypothetical protein
MLQVRVIFPATSMVLMVDRRTAVDAALCASNMCKGRLTPPVEYQVFKLGTKILTISAEDVTAMREDRAAIERRLRAGL